MKTFAVLVHALLAAGVLLGQGTPAPIIKQQFFDNNGNPLAGGMVCTYDSGTTTPRATFQDYQLTVPNAQCVVLDAAGRASIWMDGTRIYRFILKNSTGTTLWTTDGIPGSGSGSSGGGGGGGGGWTLSGSTLYNSSGNKVCIASTPCFTALSVLDVAGTSGGSPLVRLDDASSSPGIGMFGSGGTAQGIYGADSTGLQLKAADGSSQLSVAAANVRVKNTAGSGATTLNVQASTGQSTTPLQQWQNNAGTNVAYMDPVGNEVLLTLTANSTLSNAIGAPNGGLNGKYLITTDSLFFIEEPQPLSLSGPGQSRIYMDSSTHSLFASINGGAYAPFGGGGGGGGTPGGPTTAVQFNTSGAFAGSADLTWASNQLTVTGTVQSTVGFITTGSLGNDIQAPTGGVLAKFLKTTESLQFVSVSAPGLSAASQSRLYMDSGTNQVMLSKNTGAYERLATQDLAPTNGNCAQFNATGRIVDAGGPCTVGGGGGTVTAGLATEVAYYPSNGTTVAGSTFFYYDNTLRLLTVNGIASTAGMAVANGYMQADGGFLTTSANYNAINVVSGGIGGRSLTASKYIQAGNNSGPPTASTGDTFHPGALSWDLSTHRMKVYNESATWQDLGGGTGTPGGADTNIQYNSGGLFGGSSNLTWDNTNHIARVLDGTGGAVLIGVNGGTPFITGANAPGGSNQNFWYLGAASSMGSFGISDGTGTGGFDGFGAQIYGTAYNGLLSAKEHLSGNTGTAFTFANQNSKFLVTGDGDVTASGVFNAGGASSGFNVTSNTALNSIQTRGGFNAGSAGSPNGVYQINSTTKLDSGSVYVNTVNATGTLDLRGSNTVTVTTGGLTRGTMTLAGTLLLGMTTTDISTLPGAIVSADSFISASAATNASIISMAATPSSGGADISVGKTGTGTLLPLRFYRNPQEVARFDTSNRLLVGMTSSDVSCGVGCVIFADSLASATGTSNASVGSFKTIAGNFLAIGSGHTGSGPDLPIALFTGGAQRLTIQTNGHIKAQAGTPSISGGTGCFLVNANDVRGQFNCSGSGSPTITFSSAYGSTPICVVTQLGAFFVGLLNLSNSSFQANVPGSSGGIGVYHCLE